MNNDKKLMRLALAAGMASLFAMGCAPDPADLQLPPPPSTTAPTATQFKYATTVGVPVQPSADPKLIQQNVAAKNFRTRPDPFSLLPIEMAFDRSQKAERVLGEIGGFTTMFEPEPEVDPTEQEFIEPQPYRRLAGVLVGDTVSAIIIMENGEAHLIKPGTRIPDSPWRVVSIDEEKAILRRAGNIKPTQIVVRLETPPAGAPGAGGGGFPGGGGGGGGRAGGDDDLGGGGGRPGGGGRAGGLGGDR